MRSLPETQDASSSTADTVLRVNCFEPRCRTPFVGNWVAENYGWRKIPWLHKNSGGRGVSGRLGGGEEADAVRDLPRLGLDEALRPRGDPPRRGRLARLSGWETTRPG